MQTVTEIGWTGRVVSLGMKPMKIMSLSWQPCRESSRFLEIIPEKTAKLA